MGVGFFGTISQHKTNYDSTFCQLWLPAHVDTMYTVDGHGLCRFLAKVFSIPSKGIGKENPNIPKVLGSRLTDSVANHSTHHCYEQSEYICGGLIRLPPSS